MFPVPRPNPNKIPFIVGLISLITCSVALSISDSTKAGIRNAGHMRSEESFLAAGSNHMSNEFWSTGKNNKKEDVPEEAYEPDTLRDGRKPSKRHYLTKEERLNSYYDPRNYVDDRVYGDNNKIKIKNRKKDGFKRGSDPQLGNFYPDPTVSGVANPRQNVANWVLRNDGDRMNFDAKLKNDKIYFERQYPNHNRINRQNSYLGRNHEEPARSGYNRRREMSYDYNPYGQGFGQEQIYYYYYDPDVDSLSLGFNSHNRHHMAGSHTNEDVIMYPDDAGDTRESSSRFRKKYKVSEVPKYESKLKEQNNEGHEKPTSNIDQTSKKSTVQNSTIKTVTKMSANVHVNNTTSKTVTNSKKEIKHLNLNPEHDQHSSHTIVKEEPTTTAKTTVTTVTSTEMSSSSQIDDTLINKENNEMIKDIFENHIGDYQSLKPDISPYRMAVSGLGQNGTNASSNDSNSDKLNELNSQPILATESEEPNDKRNITNRSSSLQESNELSTVSSYTENTDNITKVSKYLEQTQSSVTTPLEKATVETDKESPQANQVDGHQKHFIDSGIKRNVNDHMKIKELVENKNIDSNLTEQMTTRKTFSTSLGSQTKRDEQRMSTGTNSIVTVKPEKLNDSSTTTQIKEEALEESTLPGELNSKLNGTESTLNKTSDTSVGANSNKVNSALMKMERDFLKNIMMMPTSLLNNFTISSDKQVNKTVTYSSIASQNEYNNTALDNMTTILNSTSSKNTSGNLQSSLNNTETVSPNTTSTIVSNAQTNDLIRSTSNVSMSRMTYENGEVMSNSTTEKHPSRSEITRSVDVTEVQYIAVTDQKSDSNFTKEQLIPNITNAFEMIDETNLESLNNNDNRSQELVQIRSNPSESYKHMINNETVYSTTRAYNLSADVDIVKIHSSVEPSRNFSNSSTINSNEGNSVDHETINSPASRSDPSLFSHSSGEKHFVMSRVTSNVRPDPFKRLFSLPVINSSKDNVSSDLRDVEESRQHLDEINISKKPTQTSISINSTASDYEQNNLTETNLKNNEINENFTNNQYMLSNLTIKNDKNSSSVTNNSAILTHQNSTLKSDANNINNTNLNHSKNGVEHEKINSSSNHTMNNKVTMAMNGVINVTQEAFDRDHSNLLPNTTLINKEDFIISTLNNKNRTMERSQYPSSGTIGTGMTDPFTDKPNTNTVSSASGLVDRSDVPADNTESQGMESSIKLMRNQTSIYANANESQFVEGINSTSYAIRLNTSFISKSPREQDAEIENNKTQFDTLTGSYPLQNKIADKISQEIRQDGWQSIHSTSMNTTENTDFNVSSFKLRQSAIPLTQSNMSLTQTNVSLVLTPQTDGLENRSLNFKANQNSNPPNNSSEFEKDSNKRQIEASLNNHTELQNNSNSIPSNITERPGKDHVLISEAPKTHENGTEANVSKQSYESELNETMPPFFNDTDYEDIKIPETSAYMVQDFSLRRADFVQADSTESFISSEEVKQQQPESESMHSSQNMTSSSHGCPSACPSMSAPPSPRVRAAVSAVLTSHFGPTKGQIIPFDLELLDLANNYDNTTGMFICTIPGTYVISLYLMSHPGAKVNARVFINNRPIAALWADDSKNAGFYPSSSIQTIVQLGFGDQAYVMLVDGGYGDSWVHANYNVFTIFLLYEQTF